MAQWPPSLSKSSLPKVMEANGTDNSVADWSKSFYTKSSAFVSGQPLSSPFRVFMEIFVLFLNSEEETLASWSWISSSNEYNELGANWIHSP